MIVRGAPFLVGAALLTLGLVGCTSGGPPPPGFAINVYAQLNRAEQGSFELHVDGTRFTPGGSVTVRYANIPGLAGSMPGKGPFPTVQPDGSVMYTEAMHCTSEDMSDWPREVFVTMEDLATGNFAIRNFQAIYWVCPVYR
jgi:hypothetical protein